MEMSGFEICGTMKRFATLGFFTALLQVSTVHADPQVGDTCTTAGAKATVSFFVRDDSTSFYDVGCGSSFTQQACTNSKTTLYTYHMQCICSGSSCMWADVTCQFQESGDLCKQSLRNDSCGSTPCGSNPGRSIAHVAQRLAGKCDNRTSASALPSPVGGIPSFEGALDISSIRADSNQRLLPNSLRRQIRHLQRESNRSDGLRKAVRAGWLRAESRRAQRLLRSQGLRIGNTQDANSEPPKQCAVEL